jgi:hypothetical protein
VAKWVQHKSGQGEKYKVVEVQDETVWRHDRPLGMADFLLPKSEYLESSPPAIEWIDVTEEYMTNGFVVGLKCSPNEWATPPTDRLRKIEIPYGVTKREVFIIERRTI